MLYLNYFNENNTALRYSHSSKIIVLPKTGILFREWERMTHDLKFLIIL